MDVLVELQPGTHVALRAFAVGLLHGLGRRAQQLQLMGCLLSVAHELCHDAREDYGGTGGSHERQGVDGYRQRSGGNGCTALGGSQAGSGSGGNTFSRSLGTSASGQDALHGGVGLAQQRRLRREAVADGLHRVQQLLRGHHLLHGLRGVFALQTEHRQRSLACLEGTDAVSQRTEGQRHVSRVVRLGVDFLGHVTDSILQRPGSLCQLLVFSARRTHAVGEHARHRVLHLAQLSLHVGAALLHAVHDVVEGLLGLLRALLHRLVEGGHVRADSDILVCHVVTLLLCYPCYFENSPPHGPSSPRGHPSVRASPSARSPARPRGTASSAHP